MVIEPELQELLKIIGLDQVEIQEVLVLVLNKLFYYVILLIEKLLETMDQLLQTGNYHHHHDRFIKIYNLKIYKKNKIVCIIIFSISFNAKTSDIFLIDLHFNDM